MLWVSDGKVAGRVDTTLAESVVRSAASWIFRAAFLEVIFSSYARFSFPPNQRPGFSDLSKSAITYLVCFHILPCYKFELWRYVVCVFKILAWVPWLDREDFWRDTSDTLFRGSNSSKPFFHEVVLPVQIYLIYLLRRIKTVVYICSSMMQNVSYTIDG